MSSLWVSPKVARELVDQRIHQAADILKMVRLDPLCVQLTTYARGFDEKVSVVKASEKAEHPGIRPGFYHVMRFNEGAPLSINAIEAPDGGFMVPTTATLDRLRDSDMWNSRVVRDRRRAHEAEQEAIRRQEQQETADRQQEILERWKAVSETQISMNDSTPWSQNVKGRRKGKG